MSFDKLFITVDEVITSKKEAKVMAKSLNKEIEKKFEDQIQDEKYFLLNYIWSCPPSVKKSILESYDNWDFEVINNHNDYYLFDQKDLQALSCFAKDLTLFEEPTYRSGYKSIKDYIKNLRLIGKPSTDGFAMSAYLDGDKPIVIKAPRELDKYTNSSVNHELVVGKILNNLRSIIPNFAFMIGSFKCGPPIIRPPTEKKSKNNGELISWCRGGEEVKYIIYENVTNSVTIMNYCTKCSAEDYMAMLIQTMYALNVAYKEHGFTHYDLHGNNVLFRKVKGYEQFYIPYGGDFVFAEGIVTIIDYGRAFIRDPETNKSYGMLMSNGPKGNIHLFKSSYYMDQSHPLIDCYKFTNYTLHVLMKYNKDVYNKVKSILYYFYDEKEDIDEILDSKDLFAIPAYGPPSFVKKIKRFRYEYFIKYCREFCISNDIPDPVISGKKYEEELDDYVIFPGSNGKLRTIENSKEEIDKFTKIEDYFDYIESISKYSEYMKVNNEKFGGDSKTMNHNRLNYAMLDEIKKRDLTKLFKEEENKLNKEMLNISKIDYKKLNISDMKFLKNDIKLSNYLDYIQEIVKHLEILDDIERKIEMLSYICMEVFDNTCVNLEFLIEEFKKIDERKLIYNFVYQDIIIFRDYLYNKEYYDDYDNKFEEIMNSLFSIVPIDN